MELLERNNYLSALENHFKQIESGKGQAVFLMGEAGIGKTSLVNHWVETKESKASVYIGACDSLFTPRPLGPLFDIAPQISQQLAELLLNEKDRTRIFTSLIQHLAASERPVILVFEDLHWADDATLDLVKFLSRRINRLRCLLIATYRDDEIKERHPLTTLFGEIPSDHFSKIPLAKFSKEIVELLASRKGYPSGQQLFQLTAGNPFYVMEILSGDNSEIPERVKDSILARFHSVGEEHKALWELLSILPSGRIESYIVEWIEQEFGKRLNECIVAGVVISRPGYLSFRHELFRLTIEESLSPSKRKGLHKKMLQIIQSGPPDSINLSQLVHHARFADEKELVAELAPKAAKDAATVGAHREAVKLYTTAIEYSSSDDVKLANLYERHAYESYLTYQLAVAIDSQEHALELWRKQKNALREGDSMRFLSRLWWFTGDQKKALAFGHQSIDALERDITTPTSERALAYSNLAQLAMLAEDEATTLSWGNKAIELATQLGDKEILAHALNNVGAAQLRNPSSEQEGERKLHQSLTIALENGYHEHAARAYINLAFTFMVTRRYERSFAIIEMGIRYCEERDLDFLTYYMLGCKARLLMETGAWKDAQIIGKQLQSNHHHLLVRIVVLGALARIEMRSGRFNEARELLNEVKEPAMATHELQRIIPILAAELELKWLSGQSVPASMVEEIKEVEDRYFPERNNSWYYSELNYWKSYCGLAESNSSNVQFTMPYNIDRQDWKKGAEVWKKIGCPYEQALSLLRGDEEHQRQGLEILDAMGAIGASNHFRSKLKLRGPRESTLNNPGQLTDRQIDILNLLSKGLHNKEIADKLFISPKTVDHHISAILSKLEVSSRAKAVVEAQKLGILK